MTKCSVFIATSLDGFISRTDGSIDWLNKANAIVPEGEDCGYAQFMSSIDALILGRNTFEQVLTFGEWAYKSIPVVVLSRHLNTLPSNVPATVSLSAENPTQLVERLSAEGLNHLYVDGGITIQSFLAAGLIDEITVTIIPVLLGSGKSLFGALPNDLQIEHVASKVFDFGFVQSRYRVINKI
jgi:dihydrofolate reductase